MGLSSFWSALINPRVKEITPHRPFSFEGSEPTTSYANPNGLYSNPASAMSEVILRDQPQSAFEEKKAKRRSRAFSMSSKKSEGQLRKRKSWFGGKPAPEDAPAVPTLPQLPLMAFSQAQPRQEGPEEGVPDRPGTALTTDDPMSWSRPVTAEHTTAAAKRKSQRMSLGGSLLTSRKRRQSRVDPVPQLRRQQSVFGGLRELEPSAPAVSGTTTPNSELINPDTGMVPSVEEAFDKKRGRRKSIARVFSRARSHSNASTKNKRKSWWTSSNPDDDESTDEPPPLPALPSLMHDDGSRSPESNYANTASPDNSDIIDHAAFADHPIRTVTRGTSIKQPRPVSGLSMASKRSYTPKSAASGFINSTSARSSRRHSLLDDGESGMICLSDEQQREWDKLKHLMETLERRDDRGVIGMLRELEDEEDQREGLGFSNAQALAALEFGTAK